LRLSHDIVEQAAAKLGMAQAQKALGNTDSAGRALADATASIPAPALDRAAHQAGLDTPAELGWSIGKAYAAAGNAGKTVDYLGTEGVSWLSSEMALDKNIEGLKLFDAHDFNGARSAFFMAAELIPMEPIYWRNAARTSFELGRYQESVSAFQKAASLEPLSADHVFGLALSYAVLGDYRRARELLEKGALDYPGQDFLSYWAVDMAYGAGGWDEALATWSRRVRHGGEVSRDDWYDVWVHVRGGIHDIAERAEKQGAHYLALRHESVLYHVLGEGLKRDLLSRESRALIRQERQTVFNKIIDNYRRLPLKPVIAPDIQELVLQAQPFLNSAFQGYSQWSNAVGLYEQIVESAPWWPEGHYTLALLACQKPYMYAYGELSNPDSGWVAGHERSAYLALIPDGPDAVRTRKILEGCHQ
jgi:tetratricopeptide (TPR) repeat protein